MLGIVSRRYSRALFELARSEGKIDEYLNQLKELKALTDQNPDFFKVLEHPKVTIQEKYGIIDGVFANAFDKAISDFLKLLIEKDRLHQFESIINNFTEIYYEYNNIVKAEVTSAFELSEDEKEKLKTQLEQVFKQAVILDITIDKSIIGGLYIKARDKVIDATVKGRLEKIKDNLLHGA